MAAFDKVRLFFALMLALASVYASYYGMAESAPLARYGVLLGGLLAAAVVVYFSPPGRDFLRFARDSAAETRKVVWPTRQETARMTAVVCALVTAFALFLWLVDFILGYLWEQLAL